jgi:Protein of unknown function (DUF3551)
MRLSSILSAVFILPATLAPVWAQGQPFPYDPYPWCAVYSGRGGGASNCGFRTWDQCMATVSGIGGFCQPNQFYNPRGGSQRSRKKQPS